MKKNDRQIGLRLSLEMIYRLKKLAAEQDTSLRKIIEKLIEIGLKEKNI